MRFDPVDRPLFSAICCTYGRWWHLEEAIESFLRQDYWGRSELVIINDMPDQHLTFTAPLPPMKSIRIFNLKTRMVPNNLKFDFGVQQAHGEYCCFWDDDDISLPWRLELSAKYLEICNYWSMPWRWHLDANKPPELINCGLHGGDAFRRDAYLAVGGSSGEDGHNDQVAYKRLRAYPGYVETGNPEDCFYIYRWGGITAHHSAYGASVHHCMRQFDRTVRADARFRAGPIDLKPRYHANYEKLCETQTNKGVNP